MAIKKRLPVPVVDRLAKYYLLTREKRKEGVDWMSSTMIARALRLTCSTVRQDLSYVRSPGGAKVGYDTRCLERALREELGADRTVNVAIIGAGNMGKALARHRGFPRHGFRIRAIFDIDPATIGKKIGKLVIAASSTLIREVRRKRIEIGVIAVPESAAQRVADELILAGIKGILNLSEGHVRVPDRTCMLDVRISAGLLALLCQVKANGR